MAEGVTGRAERLLEKTAALAAGHALPEDPPEPAAILAKPGLGYTDVLFRRRNGEWVFDRCADEAGRTVPVQWIHEDNVHSVRIFGRPHADT